MLVLAPRTLSFGAFAEASVCLQMKVTLSSERLCHSFTATTRSWPEDERPPQSKPAAQVSVCSAFSWREICRQNDKKKKLLLHLPVSVSVSRSDRLTFLFFLSLDVANTRHTQSHSHSLSPTCCTVKTVLGLTFTLKLALTQRSQVSLWPVWDHSQTTRER